MAVSEISLADVARSLDALMNAQMTGQARIVAHLVAAAEAAGEEPARIIRTLESVAAATAADEFWITDECGAVYLTTVRDENGAPVPFQFNPDPEVQPQASAFHRLLASPLDSDDVVAQEAQVREIDNGVFKYVGVSGVDRHRIVQAGSALAFEEQVRTSHTYTSPVMTSVLAAFEVPELLEDTFTSEFDEIRPVFEEILRQQMVVQAVLAERFAAAAVEAGWSAAGINGRLRRIVRSSPIGEIHVVNRDRDVRFTSLDPVPDDLPDAGDLGPLMDGSQQIIDQPTAPRPSDGAMYKYVASAAAGSPRIVQVGQHIPDSSPVSPRFQR